MRDSANDVFFTAESLENLSEAVVREGIQNSLDAAQRGAGNVRQVRVRIRFVPSASPDARGYLACCWTFFTCLWSGLNERRTDAAPKSSTDK